MNRFLVILTMNLIVGCDAAPRASRPSPRALTASDPKIERLLRPLVREGPVSNRAYFAALADVLDAKADGTLDAMTHEAIAMTSQFEEFSRNDTGWGGVLYKSANSKFVHKLVRLDAPTSSDMRAPGAATGVYALECAMDELAVALKSDPVDLRMRCYSERDQNDDTPYTRTALR